MDRVGNRPSGRERKAHLIGEGRAVELRVYLEPGEAVCTVRS